MSVTPAQRTAKPPWGHKRCTSPLPLSPGGLASLHGPGRWSCRGALPDPGATPRTPPPHPCTTRRTHLTPRGAGAMGEQTHPLPPTSTRRRRVLRELLRQRSEPLRGSEGGKLQRSSPPPPRMVRAGRGGRVGATRAFGRSRPVCLTAVLIARGSCPGAACPARSVAGGREQHELVPAEPAAARERGCPSARADARPRRNLSSGHQTQPGRRRAPALRGSARPRLKGAASTSASACALLSSPAGTD